MKPIFLSMIFLLFGCNKNVIPENPQQHIVIDAIRAAERNDLDELSRLAGDAVIGITGGSPDDGPTPSLRSVLAPGKGSYKRDCELVSVQGGESNKSLVSAHWDCNSPQGHQIFIRLIGEKIISVEYVLQL